MSAFYVCEAQLLHCRNELYSQDTL